MTDQPSLRDRIAEALYRRDWPLKQIWAQALAGDRKRYETLADAVLAVLPAPADRAAVLAEVEAVVRKEIRDCGYAQEDGCDFCNGVSTVLEKIRRMADEAQQAEEAGR